MSTINEINTKIDQTVRIFDQFYNYAENIPYGEYDIVQSYFKSVFNTVEQANNFTVAIFSIHIIVAIFISFLSLWSSVIVCNALNKSKRALRAQG
jgi:hypothetical protein